ncbi:2,4-dihydroxyhept-2-ene-1,7-dioic acid aldolase [Rhizobium sp. CF080]|uniref:4-hydroxy-2-oxoheptanedioate aldolase n=1 Tax=Rhizobium sp. (strain CF080) TaxID=1144310 RepID=UPI00027177BD|nr:4-hydroxy-2-oxoheptanedioate aldolase [Rhizobium sp. CF080]EUB99184.1 2,4-dihydroxyhept-2-ene-1,7-dioic acid aldolase [Rhizobium sp. CF080]
MPAPKNSFKQALSEGRPQIGLWLALANPYTAEILGGAGYDWLLLDGEHAPNDVPLLTVQLQALARSESHAIIRPPIGETWLIKQLLDIGAQTLLVPMVESGEQAAALVKAVRYPPHGVRGVGAALARASAFNRIPDYLQTANDEICLLLQIESRAGIAALDEIATTDGVDGVFIGPSDLAADMGYLGRPGAPEVQAAVEDAIRRIRTHGKAAGILTADQAFARRCLDLGATFVAIGNDVTMLANASSKLLADFKAEASVAVTAAKDPYG